MLPVKNRMAGRNHSFLGNSLFSAIKSGASPEHARTIARQIEANTSGTIATADLIFKMLSQIRQRNALREENWLVYHRAVKRK